MDTGCIIGSIVGCSLIIFIFIVVPMIAIRDNSLKTKEAEEVKNKPDEVKNKPDGVEADSNKEIIVDVEYDENRKKLVEQYGEVAVLCAELDQSYDQLRYGKTFGSLGVYCYLNKKRQEERDAQIKYIKSLSKEELELYLLQKEAINQIYNKYK